MFNRTNFFALTTILFLFGFLTACTTEGESDTDAKSGSISAGRYTGTYTIPWYEDDATLYKLLDVEDLKSDGNAVGKLYWMRQTDTVLLCESEFNWSQRGNKLVAGAGRQRCKEPDFLSAGFDDWFESTEEDLSSVRNITATSFEMEGYDINGSTFWVKFQK